MQEPDGGGYIDHIAAQTDHPRYFQHRESAEMARPIPGWEPSQVEAGQLIQDGDKTFVIVPPLPVALRPCDECGLPLSICTALAMYRHAVKDFANGDTAQAKKFQDMAEEAESDYRKARNDHPIAPPPLELTLPEKPPA